MCGGVFFFLALGTCRRQELGLPLCSNGATLQTFGRNVFETHNKTVTFGCLVKRKVCLRVHGNAC